MTEHPLAEAVVKSLNGAKEIKVEDFESLYGRAVRGCIEGKTYLLYLCAIKKKSTI